MPFISYAPNQEDVLLWHALGKLETGKLINILRADEGSAKNDAYCKQITRSLSERGWQSHDLFYENDQVEQDLDLPQSQNQSIPVDLVVISGADALSQAFQDWDWGKLSPTIVLVRQDPTQKNAPIQALWQSKLTELGYQFTRQIAHSYFYSSIKAPQIHEELSRLIINTNYITEDQLNLQISHDELKLEVHLASTQLALSRQQQLQIQEQIQAQLQSLIESNARLANDHYFVPKRPRALAKKIFNKLFSKAWQK